MKIAVFLFSLALASFAMAAVPMDTGKLRQQAFDLCQKEFVATPIEPIPILDPPKISGLEQEGMVYHQELSIHTKNFLDQDGFYFTPRPRSALSRQPMDIFISKANDGMYEPKTWEDADPDYSSSVIKPPIDKNAIPAAGQVLTELIIGHRAPKGDYPQLFDFRSNGYVRFAGYPPQVMGASLRLGVNRIFGSALPENTNPEDFPVIRSMYASIVDTSTAHIFLTLEGRDFCGALDVTMSEGLESSMIVDGSWYTRQDYFWKSSPHSGFIAYSSMMWKTEKQTPLILNDEAHDSDALRATYADGTAAFRQLELPSQGIAVRDFGEPVEWTLANEDRDPSHYAYFAPALGGTNYPFRASYKVEILDSTVTMGLSLYEQATDGEYGDNIVAASTLRQDIKKAETSDDYVRFRYKTTAYDAVGQGVLSR